MTKIATDMGARVFYEIEVLFNDVIGITMRTKVHGFVLVQTPNHGDEALDCEMDCVRSGI